MSFLYWRAGRGRGYVRAGAVRFEDVNARIEVRSKTGRGSG